MIDICGEQQYQLTVAGLEYLESKWLDHYLDGWNYHTYTMLFWDRLSLLTQVISNLVYEETKYVPIQKNIDLQNWLKSVLKK